tara:strand:- start:210 stop:557 length:348 start_codon:yes stop_codon:yes gene_type:complete
MAKRKTKFNLSKLSKAAKWIVTNPKKVIAAKMLLNPLSLPEMMAMPLSAGKGSTTENGLRYGDKGYLEQTGPWKAPQAQKNTDKQQKIGNLDMKNFPFKNSSFKMKYKKSSFPFK